MTKQQNEFPGLNRTTVSSLQVSGIFYRIRLLLLFIIFLFACEKDQDDPVFEPQYLVESEHIAEFTSDEILNMLDNIEGLPPGFSLFLRYDISVYRIVYETVDTENKPVLASGAVVVPREQDPLPLISFQHGTITKEEDAPSYFSSVEYHTAAIYSSAGYIIALPDYLGYGSSKHLDHPYEHGHSLATASRDMLRAFREFDKTNQEFTANNNLFLTGYSQGGYATMALLKLLEEKHSDEFMVTAATAGAGAYNKSEFARHILEWNGELVHMNNFLWVLETYNRVYNLNRPLNYFYNEPYLENIEAGGVFENTELNPQNLFTDTFREGILKGTDSDFIEVLADNDNYNWKPFSPLQLYHGTDDDFVFYFNSETAMEAMSDLGANQVELIPVEGGDHYTTVMDFLSGTFLFFTQF